MSAGDAINTIAGGYMGPQANGAGSMKALEASRIFYVEAANIVQVAMNSFEKSTFIDPTTSFIDVSA